jgi:hypothetical protein
MAQITFKDLSTALKTLVVLGWILLGLNALAFLVGFIYGILGYV